MTDAPIGKPITPAVARLFALACGLSVANVYYAQPLLDAIALEFGIGHGGAGIVTTITQVGYGIGLVLLVPLGDRLQRRWLVAVQMALSALALVAVVAVPNVALLLLAMALIGALAVVTQTLVACAATMALPEARGRTVGIVTSGVVIGILLARAVAGAMADAWGWRAIYAASSLATLVVAVLLWRAIPPAPPPAGGLSYRRLVASVFELIATQPLLRARAVLALSVFAAVTTLLTPLVLALTAPPWSLSHTQVGLFGLAGAAGAIGAARAGRAADRGHAQRATGIALAVMLVSWLPIALLPWSLTALVVGVVAIDFGLQSVHVANQSLLYRQQPEARSRTAAAYMVFYSIGCGAGAITSTLAFARLGWAGVCALGALWSALALLCWWLTRHLAPDLDGIAAAPLSRLPPPTRA